MHLQVKVPIPIHGYTIECVVKINFVLAILVRQEKTISWFIVRKQQF